MRMEVVNAWLVNFFFKSGYKLACRSQTLVVKNKLYIGMRFPIVLSLVVASLAVANTDAAGCVTTEGQYTNVVRWSEPGSSSTSSTATTSEPGKACLTYAEVIKSV